MAPKTNLQGTKFLITASALVGIVGGWIVLSLGITGKPNGVVRDPALEGLLTQPLPTLVQTSAQNAVDVSQPAGGNSQPATPQPLRSVSRPPVVQNAPASSAPPPVVTTQSSR